MVVIKSNLDAFALDAIASVIHPYLTYILLLVGYKIQRLVVMNYKHGKSR
ncbi:MAG: hypothetical protein KME22_18485 [Hassallia sp. WJT32-NPBG1]|nr:hypothetical protein [Hassallia sp. WJT32-NPBG1]